MPFNGAGSYVRTNGVNSGSTTWQLDRDSAVNILAGRHDTHDQDIASALSNCITKDGQTSITANIPFNNKKITGLAPGTSATDAASMANVQQGTSTWGGTSSGTANAQTVTLTPAITAYAAGQRIIFIAGLTNTAAMTLNVNGLGAQNVKKASIPGAALVALDANEILIGSVVDVVFNGTEFELKGLALTDWVSWTPTLGAGGSMTFTSTTISYAKYFRQGKKLWFIAEATGTTGGSAHTDLTMTLPVPAVSGAVGMGGACKTQDIAGLAGFWDGSTNTTILIRKYNAENWNLGANKGFKIQAFYEVP